MRKQIDLDEAIIKALKRLAIESPQGNVKNYMEHVLKQHVTIAALRKLQEIPPDAKYPLTPEDCTKIATE